MKKQKYLEQHPFEIWLASDGRWKTYLPDNSKKSGRKIVARKNQKDLENCIIDYYSKQERNSLQFQTLYYQWLDLKRLTVSKGSIERLHASYKRFYEPEKINTMKVTDISYMFLRELLEHTIWED